MTVSEHQKPGHTARARNRLSTRTASEQQPQFTPSPAFLDALRASVPQGVCSSCGEPIGAARLTLLPAARTCAWCAPRSH